MQAILVYTLIALSATYPPVRGPVCGQVDKLLMTDSEYYKHVSGQASTLNIWLNYWI